MKKQAMLLLEKAFSAEIDASINGGFNLLQTKSKIADQLVESGHLMEAQQTIKGAFPVTVKGYRLTHLGRMTYCATCADYRGF